MWLIIKSHLKKQWLSFSTVALFILIASLMLLMFILRLKIIRERKSIAINKALGATTKNIIVQMTFGIVAV